MKGQKNDLDLKKLLVTELELEKDLLLGKIRHIAVTYILFYNNNINFSVKKLIKKNCLK